MNLFRRWLERLLGLQTEVEEQLERSVRLSTAVAGSIAQAEALKEAERYAAELERTHPHLAAALRGRIAEVAGGPPPVAPIPPALDAPAAGAKLATASEGTVRKSLPARPKKAALPAPTSPDPHTPTGGK